MCRSTSAIRKVPGSVARTKTPTRFYGNTSREELTSLATLKRSSTRSRCACINVQERPWDFRLPRVNCAQVLRRPSEPAAFLSHVDYFELARNSSTEVAVKHSVL